MTEHERRGHSRTIVEGRDRAPARAMLEAVGFTDADLARPIVGIANMARDDAVQLEPARARRAR